MKQDYKKTTYACFIGYIVQAIVNSFVPLLFVTFQKTYQIPLTKITLLITINFVIQLLIDLLSAGFIDKIGYRASVVIAHICAAAGLVLLTVLPELFADPFVGILMSVMIYAVGGGLLEVLVSPIIEACPTDNKEAAMSLLHSFYCWGCTGVVLFSTVFFALFGTEHWKILTLLCDEAGAAARVAHDIPGIVVHDHLDQNVAGEQLVLHHTLLAVLDLGDHLGRDLDVADHSGSYALLHRFR